MPYRLSRTTELRHLAFRHPIEGHHERQRCGLSTRISHQSAPLYIFHWQEWRRQNLLIDFRTCAPYTLGRRFEAGLSRAFSPVLRI